MKKMKPTLLLQITVFYLLLFAGNSINAQGTMPEVLDTGTLEEQLDYLDERTRIYNNFRAIREDMFQKIKTNSLDSLDGSKFTISELEGQLREQVILVESLREELQNTNNQLDEAIKNRDRLSFLGIPMQKGLYNTIVWAVIAGLVFITAILFLSNKRLLTTARRNKNDLEELREEFEAYRKQTREQREQLVVKHHNELRKLKGK
ncbi:MAG TPA: hypothetical protein ENI20_10685 [Bacteroides sp.]|nr:hypothetical protein [Bacteroides sp.]